MKTEKLTTTDELILLSLYILKKERTKNWMEGIYNEPICVSYAKAFDIDNGYMSLLLTKLENQGLIMKTKMGRMKVLAITKNGNDYVENFLKKILINGWRPK